MSKPKRRVSSERLTRYEVEIANGTAKLPKDIHCFEAELSDFIRTWKQLGCPNNDVMWKLLIWEDHQRRRKETAAVVGKSPEALRQWLWRLQQQYQHNQA